MTSTTEIEAIPPYRMAAIREAIGWAMQNQHIKQLSQLHMEGAKAAHNSGAQAHDRFVQAHNTTEPAGVMQAGAPWGRGLKWLLSRGWEPGVGALIHLLDPLRTYSGAYIGQVDDTPFVMSLIQLPHLDDVQRAQIALGALARAGEQMLNNTETIAAAKMLLEAAGGKTITQMGHPVYAAPALVRAWNQACTMGVRAVLDQGAPKSPVVAQRRM